MLPSACRRATRSASSESTEPENPRCCAWAAGEEHPDSGQIIRQNNLKMAYLPQTPEFPKDATVLSYALSGDEEDWQVQSNLVQLGITEYDAKIDTLSGGQRRKVAWQKCLRPILTS